MPPVLAARDTTVSAPPDVTPLPVTPDTSGVPREFAVDADRILPGEGDFVLEPLLNRLRDIGYGGYVSVELMNPQIWRVAPRQFGEVAMTALRKLLGQASMD